jgi:hypothetical protein
MGGNEIKISRLPLEELNLPPILYKYRTWNDDFHKKSIVVPSVYLSAPSDFEDPIDCKNPVRYDLLTDFEIFDKYFRESQIGNIGFNHFQHMEWAGSWFKNSPLRDPFQRKEIEVETAKLFNKRFGVLSLTADPLNEVKSYIKIVFQ